LPYEAIDQELNKVNGSNEKIKEFCQFLRSQFPETRQVITAKDE
jgi:hypothetical protein